MPLTLILKLNLFEEGIYAGYSLALTNRDMNLVDIDGRHDTMKASNMTLNQPVELRVKNGCIIIKPAAPPFSLDDLVAGITPENRHPEVDFGEPQGRELL